jgi:PRC-barrel domain
MSPKEPTHFVWDDRLTEGDKKLVAPVGNAKLESEGWADKVEGEIQNAIGGLKDTLKGK